MILDHAGVTRTWRATRSRSGCHAKDAPRSCAHGRARPRGARPPPHSLSASAAQARRDRDAPLGARGVEVGRRGRATRAVARLSGSLEDSARAVGSRGSPNLRGGARPLPAGGSDGGTPRLPGFRRRQVPNGAHPRVYRRRPAARVPWCGSSGRPDRTVPQRGVLRTRTVANARSMRRREDGLCHMYDASITSASRSQISTS